MNFIKSILNKLQGNPRVHGIEAFLVQKHNEYDGEGTGSVIKETIVENGTKATVLHFIITKKPFVKLNAAAVMGSICSFSVKVSDVDYSLFRLWFDSKMDNWQAHLLTTSDRAELEQCINEEWSKGKEGVFFRK